MYVCMYVRMYVCMYVCTHLFKLTPTMCLLKTSLLKYFIKFLFVLCVFFVFFVCFFFLAGGRCVRVAS